MSPTLPEGWKAVMRDETGKDYPLDPAIISHLQKGDHFLPTGKGILKPRTVISRAWHEKARLLVIFASEKPGLYS